LAILFFIGYLANDWISANELGLRRSQYSRGQQEDPSHRRDEQTNRLQEPEEQKGKLPDLFSRLLALVKPLFHRG
jgi:hypothetical protein